ncbi:MAG: metal ABC transporter ATP-binding protein [Candidatus Aminicenantes bacterium]|nr:metal ABC transporter ATP-binding protein [Candidatus Aminicenantes bacterium]
MSESSPLIAIEDISFSYGSTKVLDHVSFPIYSGDFLAIIGPNGSGKTTLLKLILGLLTPSEGEITIVGKNISEFSDWGTLGYVPQKATHIDPFFPISVKEVVKMGLVADLASYRRGKENVSQCVRRALNQVGMAEYENWRIGKLSGGQQQRVFIARAIVNRPRIIFLDEPTTGVDAQTQGRFYDMLDDLNKKESITIVLVTHETGIINRHVTQVACLNQKLEYHGAHAEFCLSEAFKKMLEEGHHVVSHRH